jgi:hypothetical protein
MNSKQRRNAMRFGMDLSKWKKLSLAKRKKLKRQGKKLIAKKVVEEFRRYEKRRS